MNLLHFSKCLALKLAILTLLLATSTLRAEMPVPSRWEGEITGQVQNTAFRLPVAIEFKSPLPHENNPLNIFIGAGDPKDPGHLYLSSAMPFNTSSGPVTLQYLMVTINESQIQAKLTDSHAAEAAKANGFSGPNVSAQEASDLMKGVLRDALGATEMFGFNIGATLVIDLNGNRLSGTIQGSGNSYTATSSRVPYRAGLIANRVR